MQYSAIVLSLLAATGALAAPAKRTTDNSIRVTLSDGNLATQTAFEEGSRQAKKPVGSSGPYNTVELSVGADVEQQTLRCQILDRSSNPITVLRGENVDITFSDAGKGLWTFQDGNTEVSQIICDPDFVAASAPPAEDEDEEDEDLSIRVTLTDGNLATQTPFDEAGLVREQKSPVGSEGPYNSVELALGADVNPDLRCQILDSRNHAITVQRGQNIDTTFADGGNGPWMFLYPEEAEVSKIVCDPAFVKASA
ncbi:uncharacterized protein MYCFIDRAFT_80396 [Pseudocercospora fijiensis CIRAD86]|uniref:Ubiquitin 3 binding protein But2 C-terminal domain-containing protein n=1 Tax=Pseudocercospora fijiensis (strain CIRAD86) TaxID=383855 RepID=M3AE26_PSEFD|nr:uncharacterized protein MYCFIDRAFT_80396 [Pseudocercospora fijiensis CIRAD86]EME82791.1 hypothetical protein MYCFIDRAFT_80396 [Pseudocercospora fijiensis CIRAD86]